MDIRKLTGWRQLALAFAAGAVLATVNAPWSFAPSLFFGIPVLALLHVGAASKRRAALIGWLGGVGYFGLTFFWIIEPFQVDAARHGWIAPFALMLMAGGFGGYWAIAFGAARRGSPWALGIFWALAELGRSYIFTGFPWALIGYGWLETPVAQVASVLGPHGLSFATLLAIILMTEYLRRNYRAAIYGIALTLALVGGGFALNQRVVPDREAPTIVRLIQPNAAQALKWLPEFAQVFYDRQIGLMETETEPMPDIVIWPETAVTFVAHDRPDLLQQMAASAKGAVVVFGTRLRDAAGNWYNGLYVIDQLGFVIDDYAKHHLVPYGEYVPMPWLLKLIGLEAMTGQGWTPGAGEKIISPPGLPAFLPMICYETIFPQHAMIDGQRPDWLVQVTNDAWYGTFSGPYQHLDLARARAIEQGLPLARSANTGVSAMIDPKGNVIARIGLNQMGFVDAALPGALPPTLYSRTGDWPIMILLFLLAGWQLFSGIRRNRR